jgi:disulfide bond formation protein DsbB
VKETRLNTRGPVPISVWVAWVAALAASSASVYFIEILGKPAATLCWLDRMLMFGLFLILSVAIVIRDKHAWRYSIPFLAIGLPASFYQQLVHWNIIHVAPKVCTASFVCTTKFFDLFGFITQATLCFSAFVAAALCMWHLARHSAPDKD